MSVGLGREDIRALLDDLSAELAARGARAEIFLVGGAALAVAYDATRATRDLDAVFIPADVVRQAAVAVAERQGLAEDWLNDAVKGFLPGPHRGHDPAGQPGRHRDRRGHQRLGRRAQRGQPGQRRLAVWAVLLVAAGQHDPGPGAGPVPP